MDQEFGRLLLFGAEAFFFLGDHCYLEMLSIDGVRSGLPFWRVGPNFDISFTHVEDLFYFFTNEISISDDLSKVPSVRSLFITRLMPG